MNENVTAFPGAAELPANPVTIKPETFNMCDHGQIELDVHNRAVLCLGCNKVMDPFDYLHYNAKTLQRAWDAHRQTLAMVNQLNDRISNLKTEEKRIKGRITRAVDGAAKLIDVKNLPKP